MKKIKARKILLCILILAVAVPSAAIPSIDKSVSCAEATPPSHSDYIDFWCVDGYNLPPQPTDKPFAVRFKTAGMVGKAEIIDYNIETDFTVVEVSHDSYTLDITLAARKDADEYFLKITVMTALGREVTETAYAISNRYGLFIAPDMESVISHFISYAHAEGIMTERSREIIRGELSRLTAEELRSDYRSVIYDFVDMQILNRSVVFAECLLCGIIIWIYLCKRGLPNYTFDNEKFTIDIFFQSIN